MRGLFQIAPAAAADVAGQAGPPEAGKKRLWGEMAADDVTVVDSMPASSMLWGSTRPRFGRTRPPSAEAAAAAAAAAMGVPIVILDDDSPAPLSNSMKQQQQHLPGPQGHSSRRAFTPRRRLNPVSSPPMRPSSISANPSIVDVVGLAQGGPHAVAPAARRRAVHRGAAAAEVRPAHAAAQRRNSNSSSSSAELVDLDADALLARKLAQEEEDRVLAQRLMQEEEQQAQVRNKQQSCSIRM